MASVRLIFKQRREPIIISGELKYRVTTYVTSLDDQDSGGAAIPGMPVSNTPLFLLKKINLTTPQEYIGQSEFIRVAIPQDFQDTNPTEFDYAGPPALTKTWTELAANTDRSVQYAGVTPSDPNLITSPSNANVGQNEYYISNIIISDYDYIEDADTAAENIRLGLQIFKERMNDFINDIFSTMNDSQTYPSGWEEYTM